MPPFPTLHLIVGVNGSGKSTFYRTFLAERTPGAEFVNADMIERDRWPDAVGEHSYEAGALAAERRQALLEQGVSFVTETVFSHPSKLDLIDDAVTRGYAVLIYHINVSSSELASERIKVRVADGGHDVPPPTVAARHPRTLQLVVDALDRVHRLYVFDNSRLDYGFTHVMTFTAGSIEKLGHIVPDWAEEVFFEQLAEYRAHLGVDRG